jgi:elongation factor G
MGDLNSRRGRVQGTELSGERRQRVTALVPTSEIRRYAIDLRAITGGRGSFSASHSHYDVVPPNLVARLAATADAS